MVISRNGYVSASRSLWPLSGVPVTIDLPSHMGEAVHKFRLRGAPMECNWKASPTAPTSDGDDCSMKLGGFRDRRFLLGMIYADAVNE